MPIIQANTISGKFVDEARWEVETFENLREGQTIQVVLPAKDSNLVEYLAKVGKMECSLERVGKTKRHTVTVMLRIVGFKHMLEPDKGQMESMAFVVPENRIVENVLLHVLRSEHVDQRFEAAIRAK